MRTTTSTSRRMMPPKMMRMGGMGSLPPMTKTR
jgi:hypothetical protein